jgi:TolB protein
MKLLKGVVLLLLIVCSATVAEGKIYLDIYGKTYKKITIAVPSFKSERVGQFGTDMSVLLNQDLDMSGFFIVAPSSLIDKELSDEGVERQEITFANWRSIGVELLFKGRVQEKDGEISLEAFLYDIFDGSLSLAKRYRARSQDWRRLTHKLSDDITLAITGEKGIMSSRIVFVSGTSRKKEIYAADIDGYNLKKATDFGSITLLPSISPNGKYMSYTSYKDGRPNLYIMDLATNKDIYAEREEGMKIGTGWLNQATLGFSQTAGRYSTIYTLDVDRKQRKELLRQEGICTSPSFSPDGTKMVFVSDMYGSPQVFIRDLSTGDTKRLTYSGTYNTAPAFSPKGDLIAFVTKMEGALEICTMNMDGSNQRVLTNGGINDSPQFSPCGRYILYSSKQGNSCAVYVMLYNGENRRRLKFGDSDEEQARFIP